MNYNSVQLQNKGLKMDFGDAIRAMKNGEKVTRKGWNGRVS